MNERRAQRTTRVRDERLAAPGSRRGLIRAGAAAGKPSHHMRTNHRVTLDGGRAEVFSKGYALNILRRATGSDLWEVWGDYVHTPERTPQGWRCSGMTFRVVHARGNELVRTLVPGQ